MSAIQAAIVFVVAVVFVTDRQRVLNIATNMYVTWQDDVWVTRSGAHEQRRVRVVLATQVNTLRTVHRTDGVFNGLLRVLDVRIHVTHQVFFFDAFGENGFTFQADEAFRRTTELTC